MEKALAENKWIIHLIYFEEAELAFAEVIYESDSGTESQKIEMDENKIICIESSYKDYTLTVTYTDKYGNVYE